MKNILITGSSRGLGLEIAKIIEDENSSIILMGRKISRLEKALSSLKYPNNHILLEIDFKKSLEKLFRLIEKKDIYFDLIIHNLGVNIKKDKHPIDINILKKTMDLNLYKAIEINSKIIGKRLKKDSKIIHIGSNISYTGNASPAYSISKGALNIYIKNFARFYAESNTSICGILPGAMNHKKSIWDEKKKIDYVKYKKTKESFPLKDFCKTVDIANFVKQIYIYESKLINGTLFKLDGGV